MNKYKSYHTSSSSQPISKMKVPKTHKFNNYHSSIGSSVRDVLLSEPKLEAEIQTEYPENVKSSINVQNEILTKTLKLRIYKQDRKIKEETIECVASSLGLTQEQFFDVDKVRSENIQLREEI